MNLPKHPLKPELVAQAKIRCGNLEDWTIQIKHCINTGDIVGASQVSAGMQQTLKALDLNLSLLTPESLRKTTDTQNS
jgi:hypothetical protein